MYIYVNISNLNYLRKSRISQWNNMLFSLRENDDIINCPLVITLTGMKRLPPAKLCTWCLSSQRQRIMNKPKRKYKDSK